MQKGKTLEYLVADVFTTDRYKGNPLAVVFTDTDLEEMEYKNIAKEFSYSETSFVRFPGEQDTLTVRSFTPAGFEVNGAGHNLLGAIHAALYKKMPVFDHQGEPYVIMDGQRINLIVETAAQSGLPLIGMLQSKAFIGDTAPVDEIAKGLQLKPGDLLNSGFTPQIVRTEVTHLMVPLKSVETVDRAIPDKSVLIRMAKQYGFEGVYCFALTGNADGNIVAARFFNPGFGIDEDPATGSAAGPLAGYLHYKNLVKYNTEYKILQGVRMNHPSTIIFEVREDGIVISGNSVIVMKGELYI
jgi:PhzF family phenazine biosynthesis protein